MNEQALKRLRERQRRNVIHAFLWLGYSATAVWAFAIFAQWVKG
jgi:hypothetical protein